jgi:hypothetical protein
MTCAPAPARAAAVAAPNPEAAPVTIAEEPVMCMVDRLCPPSDPGSGPMMITG